MRKLLRIGFGFIALWIVVQGCQPKSESTSGPKEYLIQYWDRPREATAKKWQEDQIALFQQKYPNVKVELERLPWQSGAQKLDVAVFSGNPPDIAGSVSNLIAYVEQGIVESWDDYLSPEDIEDFYPTALEACRWDGKIWAMPWYKTAYIMILNLNLFREAGVDPPIDHRWTWEEFMEKMAQLTKDRDGDGTPDQYGIGFNIFPEQFEAWGILYTEGTEILSEDGRKCLFNSPATIRGVQKLHNLIHLSQFAPQTAGSSRQYQTWGDFTYEWKTAVTCQGIWAISSQRNNNENARKQQEGAITPGQSILRSMDFDIALFPAPATQAPVLASPGVGNVAIFNTGDPEKTRLCFELVRQITTGEGQRILSEYPLFPTRRSAGNIFKDDPLLQGMLPYIANAKAHPMNPEWVNIDRILSKELQLAVIGNKPIEKAVRDGAEQVQELLDRYWKRHDLRS